ncbi:hypothetical protein HanIR_Chr08g0378571 [Helianthus annuus]|nr:hypothetical protein HanIR_Chr08g0378571 [Helianthus annuus]
MGMNSLNLSYHLLSKPRKVMNAHFTAAVKVLCSSGVSSLSEDTLKVSVAKHSSMPPLLA